MTATERLPEGWNPECNLVEDVLAAIGDADCDWLQAVCHLGFCLTATLLAHSDPDERMAVAESIAARILEITRSGRWPGEVMQ